MTDQERNARFLMWSRLALNATPVGVGFVEGAHHEGGCLVRISRGVNTPRVYYPEVSALPPSRFLRTPDLTEGPLAPIAVHALGSVLLLLCPRGPRRQTRKNLSELEILHGAPYLSRQSLLPRLQVHL